MPDDNPSRDPANEPGAEEPLPLGDIVPADKAPDPAAGVRNPITETGLPVEEQIRKEWDPNKDGGLPTPFAAQPPGPAPR